MKKSLEKVKNRLFLYFVLQVFGFLFGLLIPFLDEVTPTLDLIITLYELTCRLIFLSSITPLCNLLTDLTKKAED